MMAITTPLGDIFSIAVASVERDPFRIIFLDERFRFFDQIATAHKDGAALVQCMRTNVEDIADPI